MLQEDRNKVSNKTLNMKRAIDSLREELEAIDLYNQRADVCNDPELKEIMLHNAKEEKEHAAMILERMRKNDPELDSELREYLFKDNDIVWHENEVMS